MLDGLDDIDWAQLSHAYGAADDVPDQLRGLLSPDPTTRGEALVDLYTNVFHQGSRFEASAYAVPFLLELLADPATPDPAAVLGLLSALAVGYGERFLPEGFPVAEYRRAAEGGRELLAAKPPPWTGTDKSKKEYVEYTYVESLSAAERGRLRAYVEVATYDAVRAGVPLLRTLLTHSHPRVRRAAAYALAWFSQEADGSVSALAGAVDAAAEPGVGSTPGELATMLVASGLLGAAPDVRWLADPRPVIRWAAAIGRARVLGTVADRATVEELLNWVSALPDDAGTGPVEDEWVPFLDGDRGRYTALALRQLGPQHEDRALDALLDRLPTVTGEQSLTVLGVALRLAFPDGPKAAGTPVAALPTRQRRLAEVLGRSTEPWLIDGQEFGNVTMLVGHYGLPRSREAMLTYLGRVP
ncbi:HEAT repeat domain-containing protein [Micromonospora sp. NPDC005203]|uniref:HEAT repeat domain-containing protein n=1 Tax=Micromonospora sp. NPDC005203 TaxID=3364226 RepID=UPI0036852CDA